MKIEVEGYYVAIYPDMIIVQAQRPLTAIQGYPTRITILEAKDGDN